MSSLLRRSRVLLLVLLLGVCGLGCGLTPRPVLRVGASGDYPPFSDEAPDEKGDARRRGFDVEIAQAFALETGYALQWVGFRWPDLASALASDRFDVAMSGVTVRPERSVQGRFSLPVARTGAVLLAGAELVASLAAGSGPSRVRDFDLARLRVAVNAGGHLERVTRQTFRRAQVRAVPDNAAVPRLLAAGAVDAVVTDTLEAPRWQGQLPGTLRVGPFTADWKAYWLQPDDDERARRLDDWLLAQEASGRLAAWRARWFGAGAMPATATPRAALLAASDERLALMPFVAGVKRERGLAVVDPEREERVVAAGWDAVQAASQELRLPPPPRARVVAFYRAQIDAAVEVQRRVLQEPPDPQLGRFDLGRDLRPALLRIGDRMARLVVRLANAEAGAGGDRATVEAELAAALDRHSLSAARVSAIASSLAALQP